MLEAFQKHIAAEFPFLSGKRLLVACSGGLDSMTLCSLLLQSGQDVAVAHGNFGLRGTESDADAQFVEAFCAAQNLRFFTTKFDTQAYRQDAKVSVQMAARELRYAWFTELLQQHDLDYILTAHHADDNLETFLINLSRGTGIDGLAGIPAEHGKVIRPLLVFSREDIASYAAAQQLTWREDSSNASDAYLRNQIRHHIVPALKAMKPEFLSSFLDTQSHLRQAQSLVADAANLVYKQVAVAQDDKILFKIFELKRLPNYRAYLYQWLKDFGFTAWADVYDLVDADSGKQVFSPEFTLLKDRETMELFRREAPETDVFLIEKATELIKIPLKMSFCRVHDISTTGPHRIFVDEETLQWPLTLRKWRQGDRFQPLGMDGTKKVGKFFKDEKFSLTQKAQTWLLCSGDDIVWIVGHRPDNRFKVTQKTQHILEISL